MKILHINTWENGGAANAAKRLCRAQRKKGIDASFLCLKREGSKDEDLNYYEDYLNKKYGSFLTKGLLFANKVFNQIPVKFDASLFFNRPESLYRLHNHPLVQEADIIHLHSTVKFIDLSSFFKNINQAIVWTLHDMYAFSGGKHYEGMMNPKLLPLEKKFLKLKKEAFQNSKINVVSPSKWLKELSKNSPLLSKQAHYIIPNCIDSSLFKAVKKEENKQQKILFVAENVNDERKGFKYLLEALSYLDSSVEIMVLGNARKADFEAYPNVSALGYIRSPEKLAAIYSQATLYVIPSLEDNLPNTIIESHLCGTPVVGFDTTGISNMIKEGENGTLVKEIDGKSLAEGILKTLLLVQNNKFDTATIIAKTQAYYSEECVVNAYKKVYESAL